MTAVKGNVSFYQVNLVSRITTPLLIGIRLEHLLHPVHPQYTRANRIERSHVRMIFPPRSLFFSFAHPIYYLRTFSSPSTSLDVTQIPGHYEQVLLRPPIYGTYVPLFLPREEFSTFFPRRLESNCAYARYSCKAFSAVGVSRK